MEIRLTSFGLPAALLAASLFGACSNTARGVKEDTAQNTEQAKEATADARSAADRDADAAKVKADNAYDATKDAVNKAADATKSAAEKTVDVTKDAAQKTADATRDAAHDVTGKTKEASADAEQKSKHAAGETANAMDAAAQTMEIKTALMADKSVDASGINVDTFGNTKTVVLKGHVPTAAQKAEAARIAKSKAPDYKIENHLVVKS